MSRTPEQTWDQYLRALEQWRRLERAKAESRKAAETRIRSTKP